MSTDDHKLKRVYVICKKNISMINAAIYNAYYKYWITSLQPVAINV